MLYNYVGRKDKNLNLMYLHIQVITYKGNIKFLSLIVFVKRKSLNEQKRVEKEAICLGQNLINKKFSKN